MLWGFVGSLVWTASIFGGGKGGPIMSAAVIFSKVSGIVGILQAVVAVLAYNAIVDASKATTATYEVNYSWPAGSTDSENYIKRMYKLDFRSSLFAATTQIWLAVFTSSAIAAEFKKTTVCYGDDGAVIDCPTADSNSDADATASEDTEDMSSSDD